MTNPKRKSTKETKPNFVLTLKLDTKIYQEDILDKRLDIGRRIYNAFKGKLCHTAKTIHFKKYGELRSLEGKTNASGLKFRNNALVWNDLSIKVLVDPLEGSGVKYLMRVKNKSMKEFDEAMEPDQIVQIKVDGKTIKVRVLRFMLNSEVEEVLVTNLLEESLGIQEFKALYYKR